jgi:hypothetical protein
MSELNQLEHSIDWGSDDMSLIIDDEEDKALRELDFDDDDDDNNEVSNNFLPRNLENMFDAVATTSIETKKTCCKPIYNLPDGTLGECCICFEPMDMVNLAITECAHTFHFSCLCQNMKKRVQCPLCRSELIENDEEEETDDDTESQQQQQDEEEDDEEEDDEDEDEDAEQIFSIPQIAVKLTNLGYTMEDLLMMFCGSSNPLDLANPRWSEIATNTSEASTWNIGSILPFSNEAGEELPRPANIVKRLERDINLIIDGVDLPLFAQ